MIEHLSPGQFDIMAALKQRLAESESKRPPWVAAKRKNGKPARNNLFRFFDEDIQHERHLNFEEVTFDGLGL